MIKYVFVASQLNTQHPGVRVKTGWLGIRIMCVERHVYPRTVVSEGKNYNNLTQRVDLEYKANLIIMSLKINLFSLKF